MKHSLKHLPQQKQSELQEIASTIRQNCSDVEKIILFGSYARGNYKEEKDLKPDSKTGHISDYDILVVTSKKTVALDITLWNKISELCRKLNLTASPRILTHDIEALNIKLAEGQYFYSDIKKEGIEIYDSGKFKLANQRDLTRKEKQRIAQGHFDHWFESATGFFRYYNDAISYQDYKKAAFFLHQSAESAYKTIHLVFTNYLPKEHFLFSLSEKLTIYHPSLAQLFPQENKDDEERFELLEYAYIGGRYDPEFYISKEDLEILAKDVGKLLEITKEICRERIGGGF